MMWSKVLLKNLAVSEEPLIQPQARLTCGATNVSGLCECWCGNDGGKWSNKAAEIWMKGRKEKMQIEQLNVGGNPLDDLIKQPSYDNTKQNGSNN